MLILNLSGTSSSEQGFLVKVELSMALFKIFSFDISCFVNYILSKCYCSNLLYLLLHALSTTIAQHCALQVGLAEFAVSKTALLAVTFDQFSALF